MAALSLGAGPHHERVNKGADKDKHPDGRRHVAHPGPHAHHGAGMVVCLQGRAEPALGEDDEGVEHLVEFTEVKIQP